MSRNLPPGLRRSSAPATGSPAGTQPPGSPAAPAESRTQATSAASAEPGTKPRIVLHIAAPDLNTLRHLQGLGRITVWADHRTPAEVEVRIRTIKDGDTVKLEALLDEIAPGWNYEKETQE